MVLRNFGAFVLGPCLTAAALALGAGCAQSAQADLTPEIDPTLPNVDAGWDPAPAEGEGEDSTPADPARDAGSTFADDAGGKDAGAKDSGVDAGPKDSGPPPPPVPTSSGQVLITEVMYDSFGTEPDTEWIEIYNPGSETLTLSGLAIGDGGGRTHIIGAGVTLAAGAYKLLVRDKAAAIAEKVPSSAILYEYGAGLPANGGIQLANGTSGGVWLRNGGTVLAQADYGGWFSQSGGSSIQLKSLSFAASASETNWCLSTTAWTSGADKGTPGAPSDCP